MAQLRFSVPDTTAFDPRVWRTAYLTGIEGIPWHCHHTLTHDQFNIGRQIDESGKLHIVWPSRTYGNICLSTTSLRVSDEVYSLPVEVARGTVYRLRMQCEEWLRVGLKIDPSLRQLADDSLTSLLHSITAREPQQKLVAAQRAIDLALQASMQLTSEFSSQALEARRNNEGKLATLLGYRLGGHTDDLPRQEKALRTAFNMLAVSADFGQVESSSGGKPGKNFEQFDAQIAWASRGDQRVCVGPMIDFRPNRLPNWLTLLDDSFDSILSASCDHLEAVVQRYRGKAHLWNCATGANVPNQYGWTDEEILRLAVCMIETVRRADERTPVLLTIDQPWSEHLRDDEDGISPLHYADALIRADLGLSGIALELNMDAWPQGSFPRDPLEINRLIDRWAMLGLPLMVLLSLPTQAVADDSRVSNWKAPDLSGNVPRSLDRSIVDPHAVIQLLLSKPSIHAIQWNRPPDTVQAFTTDLWQSNGQARPILNSLANLRRRCLH